MSTPIRPTVLVADDDAGIRLLLSRFLSNAGYCVLLAIDGRDAMKVLARAPEVRVALVDLVMPNLEGIETIRAIQQQRPGVKIIAISGAFDGQFLPVAQRLGADATLTKPFDLEKLRELVSQLTQPYRPNTSVGKK